MSQITCKYIHSFFFKLQLCANPNLHVLPKAVTENSDSKQHLLEQSWPLLETTA